MWIVIERSKENPQDFWLSGVFKKHPDAQDYLSDSVHQEFHQKFHSTPLFELREIPAQDYPVIFVKEPPNNDYIYVPPEELAEKLLSFEKIEDEDHQYCIYYIVREDYRGVLQGETYLKWMDHHHVENREMSSLLKLGLSVRCVGDLQGIYECEYCRKRSRGILAETGYGPPSGWQIIPYLDVYKCVCSEHCRQFV